MSPLHFVIYINSCIDGSMTITDFTDVLADQG